MNIRILSRLVLAAAPLVAAVSCAKEPTDSTYSSSKKVLEAWLNINYPDISPSGRGIYIIDSRPGTGQAMDDSSVYVFVDYSITDLEGNYVETTDETINRRLGTYVASNYYGARVMVRKDGQLYAGVEDMLDMMNVGGYMKAVIPSWFLNSDVYDDVEEYYANDPGGSHYIYEISLKYATDDIEQWEKDTLESYSRKYYDGLDSLMEGFYYKVLNVGMGDTIPNDSTIYIRYVGKLLDGHVFDTNIRDTAKKYGIFDDSKDYDVPAKVKMSSSASGITLESSTVVTGFGETLFRMDNNQEVVSFFSSDMGYGASGSGNAIPPYSPLVFHVTIVEYDEYE